MKQPLPDFGSTHILVVGDVMLDRYWHGATSRISPEAPVPIVHVQNMEERPGGAGNVALNITTLGARTTLLGLCGDDAAARTLEIALSQSHVQCRLQKIPHHSTITKLRVMSQHQQLIRCDDEKTLGDFDEAAWLAAYQEAIAQTDVVLLSDYGKGALKHAPRLIAEARKLGKPVLVDPKSTDFSHYHGATLITPNRKEFEAVVGRCDNEEAIIEKGMRLIQQHDFHALLITRGEQGMTLLSRDEAPLQLSTHALEVYDVTGAGDTVIATLAAALGAGCTLSIATTLSNLAAGIVVGKLGAVPVTRAELRRALLAHSNSIPRGILSESALQLAIEDAQAHGETIVMTNGCFDILHAGHVTYLAQAKALGDRLIVAVNDDASVARLKGPTRPLNSLQHRMTVLSALASVDWVVSFSEDTPVRLVDSLHPNIYVKGGDYSPDTLPEAKVMLKNGGHVKILDFVEGCSTSNLVKKIKEIA